MPDSIDVPLRSKRQQRAQTVQKLNHVVPAMGLLLAGLQAVRGAGRGFGFYLGVFEVVSAAALIVLTARELRTAVQSSPRFARRRAPPAHPEHAAHPAHHEHGAVDWVDIAAGFVLVAEVLEHWHTTGHISRPTVLTALITFAMGLSHGRVHAFTGRRRTLRVTNEGVDIPRRPFKARRLRASWAELHSIDVGPRWVVVKMHAGHVRKVDLHDVEDEAAVRAALHEADRRKRLSEDPEATRR